MTTPDKKLIDCYWYLQNQCTKGEEVCEYRHSAKALKNPIACQGWKEGTCRNLQCSFRHASQGATKCAYFAKGECTKGAYCPFAHVADNSTAAKSSTQVTIPDVNSVQQQLAQLEKEKQKQAEELKKLQEERRLEEQRIIRLQNELNRKDAKRKRPSEDDSDSHPTNQKQLKQNNNNPTRNNPNDNYPTRNNPKNGNDNYPTRNNPKNGNDDNKAIRKHTAGDVENNRTLPKKLQEYRVKKLSPSRLNDKEINDNNTKPNNTKPINNTKPAEKPNFGIKSLDQIQVEMKKEKTEEKPNEESTNNKTTKKPKLNVEQLRERNAQKFKTNTKNTKASSSVPSLSLPSAAQQSITSQTTTSKALRPLKVIPAASNLPKKTPKTAGAPANVPPSPKSTPRNQNLPQNGTTQIATTTTTTTNPTTTTRTSQEPVSTSTSEENFDLDDMLDSEIVPVDGGNDIEVDFDDLMDV